jgi:hypothetical protein
MASAGHDLIAVIIGGVLAISGGFLNNLWFEWCHDHRLRKNLALAFQGEITAIQEMVRKRGYIEGLKNTIREIEHSGQPIAFSFRARRKYFSVYEAHVGSIGILSPPLSNLVARFYTQANGILEDIEQLGEIDLSTVDPKILAELYKRLVALFEDTESIGEQIIKEVSIQYCK